MSAKELGAHFVQQWLSSINPFDKSLIDTGQRYEGNPVFKINYKWADFNIAVLVYRYTPLNSENSVLSILQDKS